MKPSNNLWLYLFRNNQSAFFKNEEVQVNIPIQRDENSVPETCPHVLLCDFALETFAVHVIVILSLVFFVWRHFF